MARTKALVNNLLTKEQPRTKVTHIFEIVIWNTKWKDRKSRKNLCTKNLMYTKKFYVHEIVAVYLSKIYFVKNGEKMCKPYNCGLNRDWISCFFFSKCKKRRKNYILTYQLTTASILSFFSKIWHQARD